VAAAFSFPLASLAAWAGFPLSRPLVVFAAGLPRGCAPFSPWPRRPGAALLVACPSPLATAAAVRRARLFGLRVAGPVAAFGGWLVAAAPAAVAPLSVRFGAGPADGAPHPARQQLLF
jgi:hypothetical protein